LSSVKRTARTAGSEDATRQTRAPVMGRSCRYERGARTAIPLTVDSSGTAVDLPAPTAVRLSPSPRGRRGRSPSAHERCSARRRAALTVHSRPSSALPLSPFIAACASSTRLLLASRGAWTQPGRTTRFVRPASFWKPFFFKSRIIIAFLPLPPSAARA